MCVLSLSWNTTNTVQGRRAKSHVDTQTIQPGLGTSYSRPPIDPYLTSPLLQNPGGATSRRYRLETTMLTKKYVVVRKSRNGESRSAIVSGSRELQKTQPQELQLGVGMQA